VTQESITRRPSTLSSMATALAGIGAVLVGLAVMDERVRVELSRIITDGPASSNELTTMSARLEDFMVVGMQAVRDQSIEHAPLVIFALAALVLVLFMIRS
jgi:hypothetical protein